MRKSPPLNPNTNPHNPDNSLKLITNRSNTLSRHAKVPLRPRSYPFRRLRPPGPSGLPQPPGPYPARRLQAPSPPEQGPLVKDTRGRTLGSITIQKNHAGTIIGRTLTSVLRNKPTLIDPDGSKTTVTLNIRGETVFSSLEIPPALTSIPALRFANRGLTSINIPPRTIAIANRAFFNNTLTELNIPEQVSSIGDGAFAGSPLKTVMISPELLHKTSVGAFPSGVAFKDHGDKEITRWKTLPPITDENGVTSIIRDDKNRILSKHLKISPTLKTIPPSRFADKKLNTVRIPDSVKTIGAAAFQESRLTEITIPSSVTSIGAGVFMICSLEKVTISSSVTVIEDSAFKLNFITDLTIPKSIVIIKDYAFSMNEFISITIPDSVAAIGRQAFIKNPLKTVTISQELLNKTHPSDFPAGAVFKNHAGNVITRQG